MFNTDTGVRNVKIQFSNGRVVSVVEKSIPYATFVRQYKDHAFILSKKQESSERGISKSKISKMIKAGPQNLRGARITIAKEGNTFQVISGNHTTVALVESYETLISIPNFSITVCRIDANLSPMEIMELSARYNRAQTDDAFRSRYLESIPCGMGKVVKTYVKNSKVLKSWFGTDLQVRLAVATTLLENENDKLTPFDIYEIKASKQLACSGEVMITPATPYVKKNTEVVQTKVKNVLKNFETLYKILESDTVYAPTLNLVTSSAPMKQLILSMFLNDEVDSSEQTKVRRTKNYSFTIGSLAVSLAKNLSYLKANVSALGKNAAVNGPIFINMIKGDSAQVD